MHKLLAVAILIATVSNVRSNEKTNATPVRIELAMAPITLRKNIVVPPTEPPEIKTEKPIPTDRVDDYDFSFGGDSGTRRKELPELKKAEEKTGFAKDTFGPIKLRLGPPRFENQDWSRLGTDMQPLNMYFDSQMIFGNVEVSRSRGFSWRFYKNPELWIGIREHKGGPEGFLIMDFK